MRRSQIRNSVQTERDPMEVWRKHDRPRMVMRVPLYLDEYDSYDSSYRPGDISYCSGDSRIHLHEGTSRPQAVVR